MPQYDRAVLVVERSNRTGVFELRGDLSPSASSQRGFVLGGRGGLVNELLTEIAKENENIDSRDSFFVDAGSGVRSRTIEFEYAGGDDGDADPLQVGDGSSDASDPSDINKWDATGAADPETKWQVLDYWLSQTEIDSSSPAELHYGLYSDGSYIDDSLYQPLDVTIPEWTMDKPRGQASTVTITITMRAAGAFKDATDALTNDER